MRKVILSLFWRFIGGNGSEQDFLETFRKAVFYKMNIGTGANYKNSGEQDLLRKLNLGDHATIFDIGANEGKYAQVLRASFPNANIHSFEPVSSTHNILVDNTKELNITCHQIGFSNQESSIPIYRNNDNNLLASVHNRNLSHLDMSLDISEEISVTMIDKFCQENDIQQIDFLKMDVEGHEISVLEGAKEMLKSRRIKRIQFEFGGCNIDSRTFFRDFYNLLSLDFKLFRILPNDLHEIVNYSESLECFHTTNYYAEIKS